MFSARPVRNRIFPIQMNSGSAVSDHDQDCPQLVVAMIEPAGADENAAMPMTPTANSDRATQKPLARMTIRASPRMVPSHPARSEEHTSELQSLMRISYAVFCLKKQKHKNNPT